MVTLATSAALSREPLHVGEQELHVTRFAFESLPGPYTTTGNRPGAGAAFLRWALALGMAGYQMLTCNGRGPLPNVLV